jgi:hypothetical protein
MDQNMSVIFMAAQAEQKLIAARAERGWMLADRPKARGLGGVLAGFVAAVRRARLIDQGGQPAPSAGRRQSQSVC